MDPLPLHQQRWSSPSKIGKHRHLEDEVPAGCLPSSLSLDLVLFEMLEGPGYEDRVKVDTLVEVCFGDVELESASPEYGSSIETEGIIARPPVIPVLQSCVAAVESVVEQLPGQ